MAYTGVTTLSLLCVLYIYSVTGRSNYEIIFTIERSSERQNVTVILGSTVTFSCLNRWDVRTTWYKHPSSGEVAAFVDKSDKGCRLNNENYPSISQGPCSDDYSGIIFSSIQYTDSGIWLCTIGGNNLRTSQYVNVEVKDNFGTTPLQVSTSQTTTQVPTRPITRVNTKWPDTTGKTLFQVSASQRTSQVPTRPTTRVNTIWPDTTVITGPPDNERNEDGVNPSKSSGYLIPAVTGASAFLLGVVFTILILKRRGRTCSQNDQGNRNPEDTNQAKINAPGGDYLQNDPQIDSHVYTDVTEGARGQVVRKEGNYSTLHSDCQEYTHMYGVIDGRAQAQMTPQQADYYNCGPQKKEDVHLYTSVNEGGHETCQTTL